MSQVSMSSTPRSPASPPCSGHWPDGPDDTLGPADGAPADSGSGDADVIAILQQDHAHFRALLDALAEQAESFSTGESVDYELLDSAIDYLYTYAHDTHHRLEECIVDVMRAKGDDDDDDAESMGEERCDELSHQHHSLESRLQKVREAFALAREDQTALRRPLVSALQHVVQDLRSHIVWEEHHFYPSASKRLTTEDWQAVDAMRAEQKIAAPRPLDARYRALLERLGVPEAEG